MLQNYLGHVIFEYQKFQPLTPFPLSISNTYPRLRQTYASPHTRLIQILGDTDLTGHQGMQKKMEHYAAFARKLKSDAL
jgi:hypothetical protein